MNIGSGKKQKPLYTSLIILVIITAINSLLARFGVIAYPVGPGSSGLYFSVAFMIAFTLWFGAWGAIAAYIGCLIGAAMLASIPFDVNLYWSFADLWQVLIPLMAFKTLDADIGLRTRRDFLIFLIFGWVLNNLVGAGWGASTFALGGIASWNDAPSILVGWFIGNLIVTIAISPLLLRYITPYIQKARLYVRKYWV